MPGFLELLAIAGTLSFAISGALQAARHQMDIIGLIFIGTITCMALNPVWAPKIKLA